MKLVGATPGFIKGPFLVEGALYGVIATLISIILMASLLYFAAPTISKNLGDSGINPTNFLRDNFLIMTVWQLLIGLLIGMLSSWLAIRKHLRLA